MNDDRTKFPSRDDDRETADIAWRSVSYLTAGLMFYGGLGWLIGLKFGHQQVFMAVGLILGISLALYLTYARVSAMDSPTDRDTTTNDRRTTQ